MSGGDGILGDIFGGTDDSAQKEQMAANRDSTALIAEMAEQARGDVVPLFGQASENLYSGNQAVLDLFGQTIPQQFGAMQEGNVRAQHQITSALPQMQNALMGLPVDYSSMQPQRLNFDTGYAQQSLPDILAGASIPAEIQRNEPTELEQAILDMQQRQEMIGGNRSGFQGRLDRARMQGLQRLQQQQAGNPNAELMQGISAALSGRGGF